MTKHYKTDETLTSIYFCTCAIIEWLCVFKEEKYFTIIIDSLKYCIENKGHILFGFVIMPSHLHLMNSHDEGVKLSEIMRDFKHYTSSKIAEMLVSDNNHLFLHVFQKNGSYKRWRICTIIQFEKDLSINLNIEDTAAQEIGCWVMTASSR